MAGRTMELVWNLALVEGTFLGQHEASLSLGRATHLMISANGAEPSPEAIVRWRGAHSGRY